MADKSAFIPVDLSGTTGGGSKKPTGGDLDIDIDDGDYFGGGNKSQPAPPAPAPAPKPVTPPPQAAPPAPPVTPKPAAAQSKKTFTYTKPSTYHKTYAGKK